MEWDALGPCPATWLSLRPLLELHSSRGPKITAQNRWPRAGAGSHRRAGPSARGGGPGRRWQPCGAPTHCRAQGSPAVPTREGGGGLQAVPAASQPGRSPGGALWSPPRPHPLASGSFCWGRVKSDRGPSQRTCPCHTQLPRTVTTACPDCFQRDRLCTAFFPHN